jgi:hypothetical protein
LSVSTPRNDEKPTSKPVVLGAIGLAAIVGTGTALVVDNVVRYQSDMDMHLQFARLMFEEQTLRIPHFLFHILVMAVASILQPLGSLMGSGAHQYLAAGIVTVCVAQVALVVLIYREFLLNSGGSNVAACAVISLSMLLVWPLALFALFDSHAYLGYVGLNTYHNPTHLLQRPFAVALFFQVSRVFSTRADGKEPSLWLTSALVVLAALAKPSYLICLLPAAVLLAGWAVCTRGKPRWRVLMGGLFLPALLVLALQYFLTYVVDPLSQGQSHIDFAPLAVFKAHGVTQWLLVKLLLSICFPVVVLSSYWRLAREDQPLRLAWLTFAISCVYCYLLAESGPRLIHGNFLWSGQIAGFILFVASAAFLIRQTLAPGPHSQAPKSILGQPRSLACYFALTLHVVAGLCWYLSQAVQHPKLVW